MNELALLSARSRPSKLGPRRTRDKLLSGIGSPALQCTSWRLTIAEITHSPLHSCSPEHSNRRWRLLHPCPPRLVVPGLLPFPLIRQRSSPATTTEFKFGTGSS